jgi:hypothetical protein
MSRRTLSLLVAFCIVMPSVAYANHGGGNTKINLLFDKRFARPVGDRPADGGRGRSQPGETWEGTIPLADPLGATGVADVREFQVSPDFYTARVDATISWSAGAGLTYDLDLFIDRYDAAADRWVQVGSGTNGQLAGDGEPTETASAVYPPPGLYRTRVVNFASTEQVYQGTLGFTSGKKGGKPSTGRVTEDRLPDLNVGSQAHAIYFVPSDAVDQTLDTNGTIEDSILSTKGWQQAQTGGRHIRLDMYDDRGTPRLDITFVRGNLTAAEYAATGDAFTTVTDELEARGWTADPAIKRYYVYYEGPAESANICGTAYVNTLGTSFAQWTVVWLGASPGCGARDFGTPETGPLMSESILMHESVHNEGMVRPESLHHCAAFQFHLCSALAGAALETLDPESYDLMFPFVTYPLKDKALDRGRDDYYNHPFLSRDLADSPFWQQ